VWWNLQGLFKSQKNIFCIKFRKSHLKILDWPLQRRIKEGVFRVLILKFFQFAWVLKKNNPKNPIKFSLFNQKISKPLPRKISGYTPDTSQNQQCTRIKEQSVEQLFRKFKLYSFVIQNYLVNTLKINQDSWQI